ncbi:hypothetical protein GCM10010521_11440 [Streptomyces rameus]|uniref:Transmembrane protein n=1 Tax=Streptomyces rameus TaxID=68261 RepID=A0ABP6MVW8_9ACTN
MPRRRLLWALWSATMSGLLPLLVLVLVLDALNLGPSRSLAVDIVCIPVSWALFALLMALYAHRALVRRARGTGIPVTVDALAATQERTFPAGAAERLRAGLAGCGRASGMTGEDPLTFRWRPFRGALAVTGSLAVDEASGGARVRLCADERLTYRLGLRGASAFVALCQLARLGQAR